MDEKWDKCGAEKRPEDECFESLRKYISIYALIIKKWKNRILCRRMSAAQKSKFKYR